MNYFKIMFSYFYFFQLTSTTKPQKSKNKIKTTPMYNKIIKRKHHC